MWCLVPCICQTQAQAWTAVPTSVGEILIVVIFVHVIHINLSLVNVGDIFRIMSQPLPISQEIS